MNAAQFYHVCRSAAVIANLRRITVFGAAAITPWLQQAAAENWWPSMELDIALPDSQTSDLVDGTIGELSLFHATFGIYGHGLTAEAFIAVNDWESRTGIFVESESKIEVVVPSVADLVVSKLVRGDDRDFAFAAFCGERFPIEGKIRELVAVLAEQRPKYAVAVARNHEIFVARTCSKENLSRHSRVS